MKSDIQFNVDGKKVAFSVVHNLDEFGQSIEAALDNWLARTKDFTGPSFVKYVNSKDKNIKAKLV